MVYLLPPLGIEDQAKFNINFVSKYPPGFSVQDDIFIYYIAEIFKKF